MNASRSYSKISLACSRMYQRRWLFLHRGLRHLDAVFKICALDNLQIFAMVRKTEDASKPLSRRIFAAAYSFSRTPVLAINPSSGAQASTVQTPNGVRG